MKIYIHVTESVNLAHTAELMSLADTEMDEMPYPLATAKKRFCTRPKRDNRKLFPCVANFLQNSSFLWLIKCVIGNV